MGLLHRFLLLTAFALLSVFAKAAKFDHTKLSGITEGGYGGRLLRTATMSDDEERGQLMPSFIVLAKIVCTKLRLQFSPRRW
ncbi:hypothetical protein PI124_g20336 [Phytophthora idaei]|nr:hypothetical protein PI125_g11103 [Phytophthora idaei]KAG3140944.1 hypothetical protein PI126_g15725 [Phytophthora idaei]KAG3234609.1 hypothetical protein PI124_g20336 [Phytophthora idaei]